MTARVPSLSSRRPKLLHPRPTAETVSSERPRGFCRMALSMAAGNRAPAGAGSIRYL